MNFSAYLKILRSLFALFLVVCTLTGCNERFYADFESDTIGQTPNTLPPSLAADRVVIFNNNAPAGEGVQVRVASWPFQGSAPSGDPKSLTFNFPIATSTEQSIRFESAPMATSSQPVFVSWQQSILGDGSTEVFFITENPQDPETAIICNLQTLTDAVTVDCGEARSEIRGFDTAEPHTFFLTLDRATRRASFSVIQDETIGPEAILIGEGKLPEEGEELWVQIRYRGQTQGVFHINSFAVFERDPN